MKAKFLKNASEGLKWFIPDSINDKHTLWAPVRMETFKGKS